MIKRAWYLCVCLSLLFSGCNGITDRFVGVDQANIQTPQNDVNFSGVEAKQNSLQLVTSTISSADVSQKTTESEWIKATRVEAQEPGKAKLYWEASGEFAEGFGIAWSKDTFEPVLSNDSWTIQSDGTARFVEIVGNPGEVYYFRVCKMDQGGCTFYSLPVKYTFAASQVKDTPASPTGVTLKITSIQANGAGKVNLYWEASGSFPNGFKILWSDTTSTPTYPENSNQYFSNPNALFAELSGITGSTNYFRICRFDGKQCDYYSEAVPFSFNSTPVPNSGKSIRITSITDDGTGKADVVWNAVGSFPKGFKVVWSADTKKPVYPGNDFVYMSKPTARIADVTGDAGRKYYFRVCEFLGDKCGIYSDTYEFTYKGKPATETPKKTATPDTSTITITIVEEVEPGVVVIEWTATGSFPQGFKVIWSYTNPTPTYQGDYSKVFSDPKTRYVVYFGDADDQLYLRVCKIGGSGCSVYSNTVSFVLVGTYVEETPSAFTATPITPVVTTAVPPTATTEVPPTATTEVPPTVTTEVPTVEST